MTSRDVIHSFFVPEFRVKADVLPAGTRSSGSTPPLRALPDPLRGYCGAGHSIMRGEVIVLRPQDYEDWLAFQKRGLPEKQDGAPTALDFAPRSVTWSTRAAALPPTRAA